LHHLSSSTLIAALRTFLISVSVGETLQSRENTVKLVRDYAEYVMFAIYKPGWSLLQLLRPHHWVINGYLETRFSREDTSITSRDWQIEDFVCFLCNSPTTWLA